MPDKLIDTNILVYAYDTSEGKKHEASRDLLRQIWKEGEGVVCLQNLMEFFVVITKKVENPIDATEAKTIVEDFLKSDKCKIIDRDVDTTYKIPGDFSQEAIKILAQHTNFTLDVRRSREFHDRFIILDDVECWHVGYSIKVSRWARNAMVKEGLLSSDSPRGVWKITQGGLRWLAAATKQG